MKAPKKWQRCKSISEWACDECRMCADPECKNCGSEQRPKWMKYLGEDMALCDRRWDNHHERYEARHAAQGA